MTGDSENLFLEYLRANALWVEALRKRFGMLHAWKHGYDATEWNEECKQAFKLTENTFSKWINSEKERE